MRFLKKKLIWLVSALILAVGLVGFNLFSSSASEDKLVVAFLDVGQGDAIFIETPNGIQALIDGGGSNRVMLELGSMMPFGDQTLDLIIATHPDKDHIGGLIPVLENYEVEKILESPIETDTKVFGLLKDAISKEQGGRVFAEAGDIIWLDQPRGIYLKILSVGGVGKKTNEAAIVAELHYGETEFLLTADIGALTEAELMKNWGAEIDTDILKVAHHGSRYSTTSEFLELASPAIAVISAGAKNPYGHPHKDMLGRLEKLKIPVLGTYSEGTIIFESDGETISRLKQ